MSEDISKVIECDETFQSFLVNEFDAKNYAASIVQGSSVAQNLSKLADGIAMLDKEIHAQVVAHHDDLLSQATGIETLEDVLQAAQTRAQSLMAATERIKGRFMEPYSKLQSRTLQLRRLQETCDLLRRLTRTMYLSKRLHSQIEGGVREVTKAAQSLSELSSLMEDVDLAGIEVIDHDRRFIKQARKEVEAQADKMLDTGMDTQNQSQIATALQVFNNLGLLVYRVDQVMKGCEQRLQAVVTDALDVKSLSAQASTSNQSRGGPGRALMPAPGNTAAFRASLWTNMEKLIDHIYGTCLKVYHLQKVLTKKRDPTTHQLFTDICAQAKGQQVNVLRNFWKYCSEMMRTELERAVTENTFLRQAFEGEFPKLLRLYSDLWRRLQHFSSDFLENGSSAGEYELMDGTSSAMTDEEEKEFNADVLLRESIRSFEVAYLSRSLSRLIDPINLATGSDVPPTSDEIASIAKIVTSELNVVIFDSSLCVLVARNVAKMIQLYCSKCEERLCTDSEAGQITAAPTKGQITNVATVNSLHQLHTVVSKAMTPFDNLPSDARLAVHNALHVIINVMKDALQPLLKSVSAAIESILVTMHDENFTLPEPSSANSTEVQCSLYMRELQQVIARVYASYFAPYQCQEFIYDNLRPIVIRCLELFIRHASLVPLASGGKMKLTADFGQIEAALAPLCHSVSELGPIYRQLRSVRPLLFQTPEHTVKSPAIGDVIPHSTILHFLHSRASNQLQPPYKSAGWTVLRYSKWLDEHPKESDRLLFIKGALESYAQSVKQAGGKEFVSVYPLMMEVLQQGLQQHPH